MKENYIDQYKLLHERQKEYGTSSVDYIDEISLMIEYLKPKTVLDYGCGKGLLSRMLSKKYPDIEFYEYDPAIEGKDRLRIRSADFLINTDVLEHIPEEILPSVVSQISMISNNCYFALHHAEAKVILPNGENAHCTIKPPEWYSDLFKGYFNHVVALRGRETYLSSVITFPLPESMLLQYERIINEKKSLIKRIRYKFNRIINR